MNNSPEQVSPVKSVELGKSSLVNRAKIIGGRATGRTVYMPTEVTEGGPKVDLITQGHYDKLPDGTPLVGLDGTPVIKSPDLVPDTRSTRHPKLGGCLLYTSPSPRD